MPPQYQHVAEYPDGRRVGWDGTKWVPIPSQESFGSRLWEAANKPLGKDVATQTRESISNLASHLPERFRGPAAYAGNLITAPFTSTVEAGRRMMTSPLGVSTAGLGGLMQELRELATVPKALKTAVGLGETATAGAFGAKGAEEATRRGPEGETGLQEFERRVGGAGQALLGTAGVGHAAAPTAKVAGREVMGTPEAPTMKRLSAALDINGLELKSKVLAPLEKAVHDDAQATIKSAVDKMEQHSPAAANKADLAARLDTEWKELVKTPETVPEPIKRLLGGKESKGVRALSASELKAAQFASRLIKDGLSEKEVASSLSNLGYTPKQVEGIMSILGTNADTGFWGAAELQQIRSDLGRSAFGRGSRSLPGPVRAASVNAYRVLSDVLENMARESGAEAAWRVGNQKWKLYNETFDGKWEGGEFHSSPLADAMAGQTADEIMGPLGKDNLQLTRDLAGRYRQFGPQALDSINKAIARHARLKTIESFSHPSKWEATTAIAYPFAPHTWEALAAARLFSPPFLRWLATRGINPGNVRGFSEVEPGVPGGKAPVAGPKGGINPKGYEQSLKPTTPADLAQALRVENGDLEQRARSAPPGPEKDRLFQRIAENKVLIQAFEGGAQ